MPPLNHPAPVANALAVALGESDGLPKAEKITGLALDPLWVPAGGKESRSFLEMWARHVRMLGDALCTSAIFTISMGDIPPGATIDALHELPPLPFPRMWFEVKPQGSPRELAFVDSDNTLNLAVGWGIQEQEQGRRWHVVLPMVDLESFEASNLDAVDIDERFPLEFLAIRDYYFEPDPDNDDLIGVTGVQKDRTFVEAMDENQRNRLIGILGLPELLVQIVHLLGATTPEQQVPRPSRRRFERTFGVGHPSVYRVKLGSVEHVAHGHGEREYRHRWLVRGHYRRNDNGRHMIEGKGQCSWVRPYIKGPEDAPWKGRPVYTTEAAAA